MNIIKRNGSEVVFDKDKIVNAITKANLDVDEQYRLEEEYIYSIADDIESKASKFNRSFNVEDIQDMVENSLMNLNKNELAKKYIIYRYERALARNQTDLDRRILSIVDFENEVIKQENSNKDPSIISVQRDYIAGEVSKELSAKYIYDKEIIEAHNAGIIHKHDMDYAIGRETNCCLVNLEDMLQNGTVISGVGIDKPHSFSTACNIATQITAQVASSQYGGQSLSLAHLAPFVDVSRQNIIKEELSLNPEIDEETLNHRVDVRLRKEVSKGIQTIQYQIITLQTTNGQAPFVTLFMYLNEAQDEQTKADLALLIEEVLNQRIKGVKNKDGVYVTPAFPKLIYVLEKDNIEEDSKYWYLTELAAKCTAKRLVPDYISEKKMLEYKEGNVFTCMGCRSFLSIYKDENGKPKFYGRFNQGVCTINLPDVALSSEGDFDKFWEIFDYRLELCHRALMTTHNRLKGTKSDVAPILWQNGALARLEQGETIDKLLYDKYSTISLGYAGLYECVKYMTGKAHTDEEAVDFAISVMEYMNEKCDKWYEESNIGFSLYGTPIESTTYKFAKSLQDRFGIIEGVTDKGYITNSYHVNVTQEIDAFTKLEFESVFQKLSLGGCISYVEVPNMQNNIPAVLAIIKHIYNCTMYAEINTKSDYCCECGFDGEIQIVTDDNGKLVWECPKCGNRDQKKMSVARRTCGYIGSQFWNQGRTQEIKERVLHL